MQVSLQNLSKPDHDGLVDWLNDPAFETLERVINSRVFSLQAKAANSAMDSILKHSTEDCPALKLANAELREAADLSRALNVLKQMRDTKATFQFATATP